MVLRTLEVAESVTGPSPPEEAAVGGWPFGELIQYCCVITVADELHFTRAAQRLNMDQSAVSRHIQKLEAHVYVKDWELHSSKPPTCTCARRTFDSAKSPTRRFSWRQALSA